MSKQKAEVGLVLCTCAESLFSRAELERIGAKALAGAGSAKALANAGSAWVATPAVIEETLCAGNRLQAAGARLRKQGWSKVLLAGCPLQRQAEPLATLARACGLAPSAVQGLDLGFAARSKGKAAKAARAVQKGLEALRLQPPIQTRRVPLHPAVLVVGAGAAGVRAASTLSALGHPAILVERNEAKGPEALRQLVSGRPAGAGKGITLLAGSQVRRLDGQLGGFAALLQTPQGEKRIECGAVVLATGSPNGSGSTDEAGSPFNGTTVLPLEELARAAPRLPLRHGIRSVALVLDYRFDEARAGTEGALRLALTLQQEQGFQVHLFCRDVRVAAMEMEKLYDQAREAGVDIVKYEGELRVLPAAQGKGVELAYTDSILRTAVRLDCELAGVSRYGLAIAAEAETAAVFGVSLDALGQLQANNIHLFPGETNRPGIFVAGACRGQDYLPQLLLDAEATALAAHALLAPGALEVELAQPVVNADKCALCLTCVRSCPHQAMYVDHEKGAAAASPEACRRCGICAGECPAKAIELPAWSDSILLSQVR
jgi:heterodisulfide reductase subunit A-like polyferredoxin